MPLSITLSNEEVRRLKNVVHEMRLSTLPPKEYEVMRIKTKGIFFVLYTSNKLVYEDTNEAKEILTQILEKKSIRKSYIGSDETGKGEWYGPLVVAGTCLEQDQISELRKLGVRDSKTLSPSRIYELAIAMIKMNITRESRVISPEKYNQLYEEFSSEGKNLNDLLAWAHSEVVKDLIEKAKTEEIEVVIDKFDFRKTDSRLSGKTRERIVDQSKVHVIQKSKGETETPVAAASVLAKYYFEEEVIKLSNEYKVGLKQVTPSNISKEVLRKVSKTHFQNVKEVLSS